MIRRAGKLSRELITGGERIERENCIIAATGLLTDEPGAIAEATIGTDDLPDHYDERDLHAAWAWTHERRSERTACR